MADKDQVVEMDTASLMEPLGKAFLELQGLKDATENNVEWSEIQEYFCQLETKMKKKFEEFEAREEEFKEKKSETSKMLAEREGAVAAKEQDLLDRIQELKDAAVETIAEARATHQPEALEPIDGGDNKETKVSNSTTSIIDAPEEKNKTGENAEVVADEVKPCPELTQFCEQMDVKGLLNYTMENQKNIPALGSELSVALKSATDPAHLVLASLEGFYPLNDTTQEGDKDNAALKGMRQSCLMFMEALTNLLARSDQGADHLLNPEIKQQAKAIADEWKPKLDAANGNSLEAQAFLQLLATFRIVSEFDEEELCKLVLAVAHQRRAPELCRSLELTHKMPGVVEALVSSGKQVDAVHFIHAFQLTESFSPVSLLKTYLKDLRRNSQGKPGNSGNATGTQNDANAQELEALKAVIQCVQEFKLQADYPLDPLLKRVSQLENLKSDKKRSKDFGKRQQHKKPRVNGGGVYGSRPRGGAPPAAGGGRQGLLGFGQRAMYAGGIPERNSHSGMNSYDYQAPSQSIYQQTYGQRSYYYPPQEDRVSASAYNTALPSYGSGMQPSHQQYM